MRTVVSYTPLSAQRLCCITRVTADYIYLARTQPTRSRLCILPPTPLSPHYPGEYYGAVIISTFESCLPLRCVTFRLIRSFTEPMRTADRLPDNTEICVPFVFNTPYPDICLPLFTSHRIILSISVCLNACYQTLCCSFFPPPMFFTVYVPVLVTDPPNLALPSPLPVADTCYVRRYLFDLIGCIRSLPVHFRRC